jgi:hypothetical protein
MAKKRGHVITPKEADILPNAWKFSDHDPNEPLYGLDPDSGLVRPVNIPAKKAYKRVEGQKEHSGTGTERR